MVAKHFPSSWTWLPSVIDLAACCFPLDACHLIAWQGQIKLVMVGESSIQRMKARETTVKSNKSMHLKSLKALGNGSHYASLIPSEIGTFAQRADEFVLWSLCSFYKNHLCFGSNVCITAVDLYCVWNKDLGNLTRELISNFFFFLCNLKIAIKISFNSSVLQIWL